MPVQGFSTALLCLQRKGFMRSGTPTLFTSCYPVLASTLFSCCFSRCCHGVAVQALRALGCMEHRGACSADDDSGDGAGLMTQIPWKLLQKEMPEISETNTG